MRFFQTGRSLRYLWAVFGAGLFQCAPGAAHTLVMKAYDRDGHLYSFAEFRDTVACAAWGGWDADALIDPVDFTIVEAWPMYDRGGLPAFDFDAGPVALCIPWPTRDAGYATLIIDNGGAGFVAGGTYVFNYVAAEDYWRKLGAALAARPGYVAGAGFSRHRSAAENELLAARSAGSDMERGLHGQRALDEIALAFQALLSGYGVQRGRANAAAGVPIWWGVTIDRTDNYETILDSVAALTAGTGVQPIVRIVFDEFVPAGDYVPMVGYAQAVGVRVMGEILDSAAMDQTTLATFQARVAEYVDTFPQIDVWEIGNEVNGEWLGSDVVAKIEYAAAYVKQADPTDTTLLTLFWQIGTGEPDHAVFDWAAANVSSALWANVDVIGLSVYVGTAPLGMSLDEVFGRLLAMYPNQQFVISETDYGSADTTNAWWWGNPSAPNAVVRRRFARWMYRVALGYDRSPAGVFWWNYTTEMAPPSDLWDDLRDLIECVHNGTCPPTVGVVPSASAHPVGASARDSVPVP